MLAIPIGDVLFTHTEPLFSLSPPPPPPPSPLPPPRVDVTRGQVELSFRLSHIDPAAAKRERRKADRERARREEGEEGESDGGSER